MSTQGTNSQNPVINQSGTASIAPDQYCTWNTANGSSSTLRILNSSNANLLYVSVQNAPATGLSVLVNGEPQTTVNGLWILKPGDPNSLIIAVGDFSGKPVVINNVTSTANPASANISAVTQQS